LRATVCPHHLLTTLSNSPDSMLFCGRIETSLLNILLSLRGEKNSSETSSTIHQMTWRQILYDCNFHSHYLETGPATERQIISPRPTASRSHPVRSPLFRDLLHAAVVISVCFLCGRVQIVALMRSAEKVLFSYYGEHRHLRNGLSNPAGHTDLKATGRPSTGPSGPTEESGQSSAGTKG
jgi:hypothetical protein